MIFLFTVNMRESFFIRKLHCEQISMLIKSVAESPQFYGTVSRKVLSDGITHGVVDWLEGTRAGGENWSELLFDLCCCHWFWCQVKQVISWKSIRLSYPQNNKHLAFVQIFAQIEKLPLSIHIIFLVTRHVETVAESWSHHMSFKRQSNTWL